MNSLDPPDSFYVNAAKCWLQEGKPDAAQQQLDLVAAQWRSHPDVLEVRWSIEAQALRWLACLETARTITTVAPDRPSGWIKQSYVLHRLNRTQEALDNLFQVAPRFSGVAVIPYSLACYAAQLQCLWEAERWLKRAVEVGGIEYRSLALREKDLEPIWDRLGRG